jgi:hypothetical protein
LQTGPSTTTVVGKVAMRSMMRTSMFSSVLFQLFFR